MGEVRLFQAKQCLDKIQKLKNSILDKSLTANEIAFETGLTKDTTRKYLHYLRCKNEVYIEDYKLTKTTYAPMYRLGNKKDKDNICDDEMEVKVIKTNHINSKLIINDWITNWIPRRNAA